jgi:hypothetical protein
MLRVHADRAAFFDDRPQRAGEIVARLADMRVDLHFVADAEIAAPVRRDAQKLRMQRGHVQGGPLDRMARDGQPGDDAVQELGRAGGRRRPRHQPVERRAVPVPEPRNRFSPDQLQVGRVIHAWRACRNQGIRES